MAAAYLAGRPMLLTRRMVLSGDSAAIRFKASATLAPKLATWSASLPSHLMSLSSVWIRTSSGSGTKASAARA